MKLLGVLTLVCLASCGDNSNQCGPGTIENDGVCEPDGTSPVICSDGTVLDELTNECVPDPSVCGGGTVLINGTCQDPTSGLTIDLMEGPEPNGFEIDATPAGLIELKSVGEAFVLKGCVAPVDNNSPDLDVYEFVVDGPTLLHIAADGVQGLAAGFILFGDDARLGSWFRMGINITTDTSKREVLLPVAGRYQLVMTDTRTLLPITQNGEGFPAAGNPDGTSCYFVTINRRAFPSAAALDLDDPNTGTIGENLKFFSASFPTGFTTMVAVIDPEDLDGDGVPDFDSLGNQLDSRAASSLVLLDNNELRQIRDADASSPVTSTIFGGIKAGDAPLLVLDYVWNYTVNPADFEIQVLDKVPSQALSTTGAAVNATSNGQFFVEDNQSVFENVNLFHFDVTEAGEIDALDIAFSIPVQGSVVDQDGQFAIPFTGLTSEVGGQPAIKTFTDYQGLIRNVAPGRYYFVVFAPRDPVGTPFTVTSTITPVTPQNVGANSTAPVSFNDVESNMFRTSGPTIPWRTFNGTADASVGKLSAQFFDPAVTLPQTPGFAFGRLDTLTTTFNNDPPSATPGDGTPLFSATFDIDGSTPTHAILRNPFAALPPTPTAFLIKVNPTIPSPAGQFQLGFPGREFNDYGTLAAGDSLDSPFTMVGGGEERFFFQTAPGNQVTISVEPTGSQPDLDVVLEPLAGEETPIQTIDDGGTGAGEQLVFSQNLSGAVAFRVRGADSSSEGAYTVTVSVVADGYTATQAPSLFFDACIGGQAVPLTGDLSGNAGDDEGLSPPIAAPTGFTLYGQPVTNFKVSSNGFLTFDTSLTFALSENSPLTLEPSPSIAPHWDDLGGVSVCTKATSTSRVIQWDGFDFDSFATVQFQAILDADGTITFVYGPQHRADGSTATIGVQHAADVLELGFLTPVEVADSSIRLTPN